MTASAFPSRFAGRLILLPALLVLVGSPVLRFRPAMAPPVASSAPVVVAPPLSAGTVPVVEDLEIQAIDPANAEAINARVPVSTAPNPPARPFKIDAEGAAAPSFDRALDCLTSAIYYEAASEGEAGGRAVAQVVINRLRHPAFPKTICDVVFQGSTRPTGCQFTFTCDGALARAPAPGSWSRARTIARAALLGQVYGPVGYATHYHTRFVVPKWRTELDKIAVVGAHIFYRWSGWWGTPPAFRGGYTANEPGIAKLALVSAAHAEAGGMAIAATARGALGTGASPMIELDRRPPGMAAAVEPARQLRIALPKGQPADGFLAVARARCAGASKCTISGWTDPRAVPATARLSAHDLDAMSFSYVKDAGSKSERSLWNCREFRDRGIRDCLKMPLLADLRRPTEILPAPRLSPSPANIPATSAQ